jgi:serine/tyrosine/threonine adenylyltransferase
MDIAAPPIPFDNSYARDLAGAFIRQAPAVPPDPRMVILNDGLARDLGLEPARLTARMLAGADLPPGAEPIAQAYAGHQFGGFSPSLGDGRAVLLGEVVTPAGRVDLHLKGSGPTPFSRGGDGFAALGPMLREYLMGEAMYALGIPTTRALAVVATGAPVFREVPLPGAVVVRVADSHLRVGTFQFFAARGDTAMLRRLVDYTLARHYPDAKGALGLFDAVVARQVRLVAQWMGVGFIHGVMNTDNMALSGQTIDYGPCAFMDAYAPGTVFSSIDRQGRYAYANQPLVMAWNLARLAEALVPLIDDDDVRAVGIANERLGAIAGQYRAAWVDVMRRKIDVPDDDGTLADGLLAAMEEQGADRGADWTLTFRRLSDAVTDDGTLSPLFTDPGPLRSWLPSWRARLAPGAASRLRAANPAVIPRNHRVEEALTAATAGDMGPFHALLAALARPFDDAAEAFTLPPRAGLAPHVTFCGT